MGAFSLPRNNALLHLYVLAAEAVECNCFHLESPFMNHMTEVVAMVLHDADRTRTLHQLLAWWIEQRVEYLSLVRSEVVEQDVVDEIENVTFFLTEFEAEAFKSFLRRQVWEREE